MESLEHHEHAEHAAHSGNKRVALIVAILAALLAFLDHGAKLNQTKAFELAISASDQWNFFQAKSLRMYVLRSDTELIETLDPSADQQRQQTRTDTISKWKADATRYDSDPQSGEGRKELMAKARDTEASRDHSLHALHYFENGTSAVQLAIVLATASVIAEVGWLLLLSCGMGGIGVIFGLLGLLT